MTYHKNPVSLLVSSITFIIIFLSNSATYRPSVELIFLLPSFITVKTALRLNQNSSIECQLTFFYISPDRSSPLNYDAYAHGLSGYQTVFLIRAGDLRPPKVSKPQKQ